MRAISDENEAKRKTNEEHKKVVGSCADVMVQYEIYFSFQFDDDIK